MNKMKMEADMETDQPQNDNRITDKEISQWL